MTAPSVSPAPTAAVEEARDDVSSVPDAFDGVASTYDLMVAMNPGYHQHLRASADVLVESLPHVEGRPVRIVDLGCGSGASTAALVAALEADGRDYELLGVDGSAGMLAQARRKHWAGRVDFVQGNAETLSAASLGADSPGAASPHAGVSSYDGVFAAYLFRNVDARDRLLAQVLDLLVPGGSLVVHEYSVRESRSGRAKWDVVCWGVVVPLGVLTAPRSGIYRYLWRSVIAFDGAEEFRSRMVAAGFDRVRSRTFRGWQRHVLHTFAARRPPAGAAGAAAAAPTTGA